MKVHFNNPNNLHRFGLLYSILTHATVSNLRRGYFILYHIGYFINMSVRSMSDIDCVYEDPTEEKSSVYFTVCCINWVMLNI